MQESHINKLIFLAKHGGATKRAAIASFKDCPKSVLKNFSKDSSRQVRLTAVMNQAADREVISAFKKDQDSTVENIARIRLGEFGELSLHFLAHSSSTLVARCAKEALENINV